MLKLFSKSYDYALDLIFPKECVGCQKEGTWLCSDCQRKIIKIKTFCCPRCKKINKNGELCRACRRTSNLTGVIAASYYQKGPIKEIIHTYKYEGILELEKPLANLLTQRLNGRLPRGQKVLVPIPLHHKKEIKRGFNQAERLAKILSQKFNLPLETAVLKRVKETDSQVGLGKKERQENLSEAFSVSDKNKIAKKTILLVDDVTTTGTTLEEAAKVLRQNGAKAVWAVVVAQD